MNTVLTLAWAALVVSVGCWGVGGALVVSKQAWPRLLAGWCGFLAICAVVWLAGWSARGARPMFWIYLAGGWTLVLSGRRWVDLAAAAGAVGLVAALVGLPFLLHDHMLVYGAHGTDMWGYVGAAEWLQTHSVRELPVPGESPMRFNWTWYVLSVRDRPLIYELLACFGAGTGVSPLDAYMALPVALMASLAMGLARGGADAGMKRAALWLVPAVIVAYHPLAVLNWVAGFASGTIVGLLVALTLAALVAAEDGVAATETVALAGFLFVACGGLYSPQFMVVGGALAAALFGAKAALGAWRRGGWEWLQERPSQLTSGAVVAGVLLALGTVARSGDEVMGGGSWRWSAEVLAEGLGAFGGTSPYAWLFFKEMEPWDQNPWANPVGLAALAVTMILVGVVSWRRWRESGDLRVPVVVGLCVAGLLRVGSDERATMAKAMPIFGLAVPIIVAALAVELRPRWLAVVAAMVACMPAVRSVAELREHTENPYILCTEDNLRLSGDGQNWMIMARLYFEEDTRGFKWADNPRMFRSMTVFLPEPVQRALERKHGLPPP